MSFSEDQAFIGPVDDKAVRKTGYSSYEKQQ
jgi:hypothetical protein